MFSKIGKKKKTIKRFYKIKEEKMELLEQEGTPVDIACLDQIISSFFTNPSQGDVHELLCKFQKRSDSWLLVQQIITGSQQLNTRFFALTTFVDGARSNWGILDESQRAFFKQFFFSLVIEWSTDVSTPEVLLNSANQALIEVLKNEWPAFWPNFMHDFLMGTKNDVNASINGLKLLSMLSIETHDYQDELLTTDRQSELSRALESDFNLIFSHLEAIFFQSTHVPLIKQTLLTLSNFLQWIDLQKVTSTTMCQHLVTNLFPNPEFRYPVLCCFDAIATHYAATADHNMCQIFELFVHNIRVTLGNETDINAVYNDLEYAQYITEKGMSIVKKLIQTIGDFLLLDQSSLLQGILTEGATFALLWLVQLTATCEIDTFKIAVEYWVELTRLFFLEQHKVQPPPNLIFQLQEIFVARMSEPPELFPLIQQDLDDAQGPDLFEPMRQTIVCLSHLSKQNMGQTIVTHLSNVQNKPGVLKACIAIGAISGTFDQNFEQSFLSHCLQILFQYLNGELEESDRMILSGCYLYICSLYPRFLAKNWEFLKQLTDKIAQLMLVRYPPLQEVTVKIFKILATRVPKPLVTLHPNQPKSVVTEFIENSHNLASVLPFDLVPILYQALALLCTNIPVPDRKQKLSMQLLVLPMQTWESTLNRLSPETIAEDQLALQVIFPLDIFSKMIKINEVLPLFYTQIEKILEHTLQLYKFFTTEINRVGIIPNLAKMKAVILNFYESFIQAYPNSPAIPTLVEMMVSDYLNSSPNHRFHQIIDCFSVLIDSVGPNCQQFVGPIITGVVSPTFDMISDSDDYPEIQLSHFKLLSFLMTKVFASVQSFNQEVFSMMLRCLLWGVARPKNDISTLAMNCVSDCVQKISSSDDAEFKRVFYDQFYLMIVFSLFDVMTDRAHKFIFVPLAQTLNHLFMQVSAHFIVLNGSESTENFLADSLTEKLHNDFPHMKQSDLLEFSRGLITEARNFGSFKEQLRTFLITIKKIMPSDRDFYRQERDDDLQSINGFFGPAEAEDDDDGISEF
ncbi:hypothetical protein TRFO_16361 [Tritrichomonas foetus]|uniref:Importin N-terminal domain-containing protein n=1 Tax=Tritrichomonas foetus TaxID=1144522 RepID=A0A1J4KQ84_9EUKA|nr:hypothetical protein TRFO_16361 [Tritrichomonas foetus]|eukprot:OHT13403.1 hypothetical protein TRFO_16361 [Tritrichomonas foetus]